MLCLGDCARVTFLKWNIERLGDAHWLATSILFFAVVFLCFILMVGSKIIELELRRLSVLFAITDLRRSTHL